MMCSSDKVLSMLVKEALTLQAGQSMCRLKQTTKRLIVCYGEFRIDLEFLHNVAFRSSLFWFDQAHLSGQVFKLIL